MATGDHTVCKGRQYIESGKKEETAENPKEMVPSHARTSRKKHDTKTYAKRFFVIFKSVRGYCDNVYRTASPFFAEVHMH